MSKFECVVWKSMPDYNDWKEYFDEEYPDMDYDSRVSMMYLMNSDCLEDERENLNIQLDESIIVIADLGLWNGRFGGYKEIASGNIKDCLYAGRDDDEIMWQVDSRGDLIGNSIHHDGHNSYLYREWKPGVTEYQKEALKRKILSKSATRADITKVTKRIGDKVANVYGWSVRKERTRKAVTV